MRHHNPATVSELSKLDPYVFHIFGWVAVAKRRTLRKRFIERSHLVCAEFEFYRCNVFVKIPNILGARDWDNVRSLRKEPRYCNLRWGGSCFDCDGIESLY